MVRRSLETLSVTGDGGGVGAAHGSCDSSLSRKSRPLRRTYSRLVLPESSEADLVASFYSLDVSAHGDRLSEGGVLATAAPLCVDESMGVEADSSSVVLREGLPPRAGAPSARQDGSRRRPRASPPADASPPVPSPALKRAAGTSSSLPMLPQFPLIGVSSGSGAGLPPMRAAAVSDAASAPRDAVVLSDDSPDAWRRFTPANVDEQKCLARTWNGGRGGQCRNKPSEGGMCRGCRGLAHGKVTGAIPPRKLAAFVAAEKKALARGDATLPRKGKD